METKEHVLESAYYAVAKLARYQDVDFQLEITWGTWKRSVQRKRNRRIKS